MWRCDVSNDFITLQAFFGLERSLHALGLVSNKLNSVPVSALESLPGLTRLDLSNNRITYIDTMPRYGIETLRNEASDDLNVFQAA